MTERDGYGFSPEDKQYARDRANGHCEWGQGACDRPNTNRVNHLTGCFQGRVQGTPKEWVSDIRENSAMMCEPHEILHDKEERESIEESLEFRRNEIGIYKHPLYERSYNRNTRHHRRKRR
jgi:hypothetical protein